MRKRVVGFVQPRFHQARCDRLTNALNGPTTRQGRNVCLRYCIDEVAQCTEDCRVRDGQAHHAIEVFSSFVPGGVAFLTDVLNAARSGCVDRAGFSLRQHRQTGPRPPSDRRRSQRTHIDDGPDGIQRAHIDGHQVFGFGPF